MDYLSKALGRNERIVFRVRKHPIVLLWPFTLSIGLVILIMIGIQYAMGTHPKLALPLAAIILLPLAISAYQYLKWKHKEYVVTTHRVIHLLGIINKRMVDSSLEMVNDVVLGQSIIGRMLDYGDVEILTASEIGVNDLHSIRAPLRFKIAMLDQKETIGKSDRSDVGDAGTNQHMIYLINSLEALRKEGVLTQEEFDRKKASLLTRP